MEAGIDEGVIIDNYNDPQFRERIYDGWMNMKEFYTFEEYCKESGVSEEQLKSIVKEFDSIIEYSKNNGR